jgi:HTH-type transcriptional regulator/antitoxin HigA
MSAADLQRILGSRQRVHDILRKKRRLSLEHVRALHEELGVPADVLIRAY